MKNMFLLRGKEGNLILKQNDWLFVVRKLSEDSDKAENVRNAEAGLALGVKNESMKSCL